MVTVADDSVDHRRGIDHIGVSVSFVVHDGKGRILLQKRGPKARDERGRWDVGGGAIEFGETIEQAVIRELKEELLTKPLEVKFLKVYEALRQFENKLTHWVTIMHAVKVDPSKVAIGEPDKITDIDWFSANNLPQPLHSQFSKSFDVALENGIIK